ncbi:putative virion core cysteine protease [Diachasmimorpha longicaudata entomopoxvirus]|uniref:Putative virion core cysteine protease n=1 Tax=Diachasmimorpha longicaudata entomopoxvirus TaxID=109981 RepID=A0A7R5WJ47_9POXV|nr:putative virion core cysteine protease [Diachasmimorpha longicaudata entomopoxvirus]AKS26333.1 putative virion core cysteine protease [Diachasmimorpha longicaudata entomopoxvirus]
MFPIQRNLRFPEYGLGFSLNLIFEKLRTSFSFSPLDYNDSTNKFLLETYDKSKTCGKVSFIPIDFLRTYVKKFFPDLRIPKYQSEIDEKTFYINLLKKRLNSSFYRQNRYQNIPLCYFQKSRLDSLLSKTFDYCKLPNYQEGPFGQIYSNIKQAEVYSGDQDEWLSNEDLNNLIVPYILNLPEQLRKQVFYIPLINLNTCPPTKYMIKEQIEYNINWRNIQPYHRFILIFIIHQGHFTAMMVDRFATFKKHPTKGVVYFFNSCGYNPVDFSAYNKEFWFLDSSFEFKNHKVFPRLEGSDKNLVFEVLAEVFREKFHIYHFVFNSFAIQNFNAECGIFSSVFHIIFLRLLRVKKDMDIRDMKQIYFNMTSLGGDMIFSMLRGLFFFTDEDLQVNNVAYNEYVNSPFVYPIKNRKFMEYLSIYKKGLRTIQKSFSSISNELQEIETKISD